MTDKKDKESSESFLASITDGFLCFRPSRNKTTEGSSDQMKISEPTDFKHGVKVRVDARRGTLVGLPQAWAQYDPTGEHLWPVLNLVRVYPLPTPRPPSPSVIT